MEVTSLGMETNGQFDVMFSKERLMIMTKPRECES
jgi:hypothetical protein